MHGFTLRNDPKFRVFFEKEKKKISPWHDIALFPSKSDKQIVNFINEIPRHSCDKMEVATDEEFNPIKQDEKKGKLRLYPFASLVNYGCLPQTWENPNATSLGLEFKGDNDPVDVVEIGDRVALMGEVFPVKVLGVLGMIDEGEMDWKVIAIDVKDPLSQKLNSVADVYKLKPGKIESIVEWFKFYKVPDGKPVNDFAFNGDALDVDKAVEVIEETHTFWQDKDALKKEGLWH